MLNAQIDLYGWQQNTASVLAVQGETQARKITARLLDSGGQPFDLTNATVRLFIPKPDHTIVYLSGSFTEPDMGTAEFVLDSQAVAVAGTCNCVVMVSFADGTTVKFMGPTLTVAASNTDGAVESSNEFTALQEALAIVHDIDNKVEKTTEINGYALAGDITLGAADVGAIASTEKGAANGVATLNASGKLVQMPNATDVGAVASTEKGAANGVATLSASGKLIQMPTAEDVGAVSKNGWIPFTGAFSFSTADAAVSTYTMTSSADVRGFVGAGTKIKLDNGGSTKYFIVSINPVYSGGVSTITMFGGFNNPAAPTTPLFPLASSAITNVYYGYGRPFGFPLDPNQWSIVVGDTSDRVVNSPVQNVWYNVSQLNITLPIGSWSVEYFCGLYMNGKRSTEFTLSTSNTSETDWDFSQKISFSSADTDGAMEATRRKDMTPASKTPLYALVRSLDAGATAIGVVATTYAGGRNIVRAVCNYL